MRRDHVASTLIRRHFHTKCPLGRIRLSNGLLCYSYKPAVSWLNWRAEPGKDKWKYSKDIFNNCLRTENSLVPNNILPFSLMFHIAERLLYFDILGVLFNEFENNFVFASTLPGKLSLFSIY